MKVVVDMKACMSNAQCMMAAPEVFEVREDGMLYACKRNRPRSFARKSSRLRVFARRRR